MKVGGWLLLLTHIILVCGFWLCDHIRSPSGSLLSKGAPEVLLAGGRLAAVLAVSGILLQLMLIGRVKWLERSFGLDKLIWVHHKNGLLVLGALTAHPIMITAGHLSQPSSDPHPHPRIHRGRARRAVLTPRRSGASLQMSPNETSICVGRAS